MRERPIQSWCFQRILPAVVLGAAVVAWGAVAVPDNVPSAGSRPEIASVSPEAGPAGTEVVVRGENFGPSIGSWLGTSSVSFSGKTGSPSYWSETEIRVAVPSGATSGPVVVTVGGVAGGGAEFTVTGPGTSGPAIATVSPALGPEGTEVVVRGENFGSAAAVAQGISGVSFDGIEAMPTYWSETEIRVPVPVGASSGPVVVTVNGQGSGGVGFAVTPDGPEAPGIVSVSPALGPAGTEVVVRGENFGPADAVAQGISGVSFSGVWGTPTYWSETQIRVPVPAGAPGGLVVVAAGGSASGGVPFTVMGPAPVIGTVDPNHGPEGTELVIRGTHFGSPIAAHQGGERGEFQRHARDAYPLVAKPGSGCRCRRAWGADWWW